jgi:flagellum-specific peptidoglycan hydrolase FlgJ
VHTLPLPEVSDDKQNTTIENGNSKFASAQAAPRASGFGLRVSASSPQETTIENGNSKLGSAQAAPRASGFGLRVSANSPHLTPQQLQFLLRVTPAALESQRAYRIPACVTIAQAILESATPQFGWGSSTLFRLANNPFGIKYCHFGVSEARRQEPGASTLEPGTRDTALGTQGLGLGKEDSEFQIPNSGSPGHQTFASAAQPTAGSPNHPILEDYGHFDAQTWEIENGQKKVIIAQFQRFPNLGEAFRCHALLLSKSPRYAPAMQALGVRCQVSGVRENQDSSPDAWHLAPDTWQQFAERLGPKLSQLDTEHCGYSTNPSYSAELIKLVNLYRLNDPRALKWYATGMDPGYRAIEPSGHRAIEK